VTCPVIIGVRRHADGTLLSRYVRLACRRVGIGLGAANQQRTHCSYDESELRTGSHDHFSTSLINADRDRSSSADASYGLASQAKMRFQSFFMLMTIQPCFVA
jgi:hypothetical protein